MNIGTPRPEPWLAAVFEGAGATLWWNVATGEAGGEVWDEALAGAWLALPNPRLRSGDAQFFARAAALAAWREAWWPASYVRGIAPLDPRILAAERAVALVALDGISDDEDAATRASSALTELDDDALEASETVREAVAAGVLAAATTDALAALADDYGAALAPAPVAQADFALAAAGSAPAAALATGSDPVDPGCVPQGVVDPFARIEWRVTASMSLEVTVAAAPVAGRAPAAELVAHIGPLEVPLFRSDGVWSGRAGAAAGILALGPDERRARLEVPGFDAIPGVDPETLARIAGEG